MKKPTRQQQRQRQKLSRKTIILICAASISCVTIGLTIYLNVANVDPADAKNTNLRFAREQVFTTEKSIAEPEIIQAPPANSKTIFAKHLKPSQPVLATPSH